MMLPASESPQYRKSFDGAGMSCAEPGMPRAENQHCIAPTNSHCTNFLSGPWCRYVQEGVRASLVR